MREILLLSIIGAAAWGQTPGTSPPKLPLHSPPRFTLSVRAVHTIGAPQPYSNSTQCDARGQLFFALTDVYHAFSAKAILRVDEDGSNPTTIPIPTDLASHGEWPVSVDPSGDVYLLQANVDSPVLLHLSSAGEELSRTSVSLPKMFFVHSFAVQPDGRSAFFGWIEKVDAESKPVSGAKSVSEPVAEPFLFWLDATGKLTRRDSFGKAFTIATSQPDGRITVGNSGFFYIATRSAIREYNAGGDLLQTFPIVAPRKDATVENAQFADGLIAALFAYPAREPWNEGEAGKKAQAPAEPYYGPLDQTWLLLNPVSGEMEGYYEQPKDLQGSAQCYLGQHSFLYSTIKDGQPALAQAVR